MRIWSLLFLLTLIMGVGIFLIAPWVGCGMPEVNSTFGKGIDHLYDVILWLTGLTFIGTMVALVFIVYQYAGKPGGKATYIHGNRTAEIVWTIIPAAILLFVALYQLPEYIAIRMPSSRPDIPVNARVVARQFEWRIVYPGPDGRTDTPDDVWIPNEMHVAKGRQVLIDLTSMDVLHSFFLPHVRIKQDAVPGLRIPVWFDTLKSTREFQSDKCEFTPGDLLSKTRFCIQLRESKTSLGKLVFSKLSEKVRNEMVGVGTAMKETDKPELAQAICDDLNAIIASEDLAKPELLAGITLGEETRWNVVEGKPIYSKLVNRQVLADAFPESLHPLRRHYELVCAELCGWGHYKMRGRLIVHDTVEELNRFLAEARNRQEATR
jgi:cytochrome c oxidase subunit 2